MGGGSIFGSIVHTWKMHGDMLTRLEGWNKTDFGHVGRKIFDLQKRLEWIELQPTTPDIVQLMRNTRIELNGWLDKEDAMWHQRSRLTWF